MLHNSGMADLSLLQSRLAAAKNLSEIARLAGVSRMTVQRVRYGKHMPNLETFNRLEAALDGKASSAKRVSDALQPCAAAA